MLFHRHTRADTRKSCLAAVTLSASPATALPSGAAPCTGGTSWAPPALHCGLATSTGLRHAENEDSFCAAGSVYVVADGMGGHQCGAQAARAVTESLGLLAGRTDVSDDDIRDCVLAARTRMGQIPFDSGKAPGSTLSGLLVTYDRPASAAYWTVMNLGDSRTYLLDSDALTQLTTDHSVVQEMVDAGAISPQEARTHRFAYALTHAVQQHDNHAVDISRLPMQPGDRVMVCSDGISGPLDNDTLAELLRDHPDPQAAADALVAAARVAGGTDDATVLVIDAA